MTYTITTTQMTFFLILALWELVWTSFALWRAARRNQPYWFIALLVVNSVGILPIIYLILTRTRADTASQQYVNSPLTHGG